MNGRGEFPTERAMRTELNKIDGPAAAMAWVATFTGLPATVWHMVCTEGYGHMVERSGW